MVRKTCTPEQVVNKLREAEVLISQGATIIEASKKIGVTEQTYYRWRREYGGMRMGQARRLKELERSKTLRGEQSSQQTGGGPFPGQCHLEGGRPGKPLSSSRRRKIVSQVCHALCVSERRACRVLGQPRATQRHSPHVTEEEERLAARITELAAPYGRYGYRRITALLQRESWKVNHKRVESIWRREGQKQPKRGHLWLNDSSCLGLRPRHKDHVWSYDLMVARTADGRAFRILTILDEYTRECLLILLERHIGSQEVIDQLFHLFVFKGIPEHIRSDNGLEFTAKAVREWLSRLGVKTLFIEPGSPWENGYIESFNGKLRDELINREVFTTLTEAKILIEVWRREYNQFRPHSSLRYRSPVPEAVLPVTMPATLTLQVVQ